MFAVFCHEPSTGTYALTYDKTWVLSNKNIGFYSLEKWSPADGRNLKRLLTLAEYSFIVGANDEMLDEIFKRNRPIELSLAWNAIEYYDVFLVKQASGMIDLCSKKQNGF